MAGEDAQYTAWLRTQRCRVDGCHHAPEVHHSRQGVGTGRRGHDHRALPLCHQHHVFEFHGLTGHFKGWSKTQWQAWEDEQIAYLRRIYADDMPF
jgi:hypothetical protein